MDKLELGPQLDKTKAKLEIRKEMDRPEHAQAAILGGQSRTSWDFLKGTTLSKFYPNLNCTKQWKLTDLITIHAPCIRSYCTNPMSAKRKTLVTTIFHSLNFSNTNLSIKDSSNRISATRPILFYSSFQAYAGSSMTIQSTVIEGDDRRLSSYQPLGIL